MQHVKALFNHALRHELWRGENPAQMVALNHEQKRKRYLLPSETYQFFAALKNDPNPDMRDFVGLALWTAARKSDVMSMRWQDVQLDDNRWTVPNPKNSEPYDVALTPEAVEIENRQRGSRASDPIWVFPGVGKSGHIVDLKTPLEGTAQARRIEDLNQHDLRRTLEVGKQREGIAAGHREEVGPLVGAGDGGYSQLNLDPVGERRGGDDGDDRGVEEETG